MSEPYQALSTKSFYEEVNDNNKKKSVVTTICVIFQLLVLQKKLYRMLPRGGFYFATFNQGMLISLSIYIYLVFYFFN